MSIQMMLLGVGAVATKTYVDDVFSTYLYNGQTNTATQIQNGLDLAGEGGMVWLKCRSNGVNHSLYDTVRGVNRPLESNSGNAAQTSGPNIGSFNSNGFTHASSSGVDVNETGRTFSSWTFRKSPGFFDVVTWTGNGSDPRNISHSLGSNPGCIFYKRTDASADWVVYNRHLTNPATYLLQLDGNGAEYGTHGDFGSTLPTASVFTVASNLNTSGATYVAYIFAGGESTAATARSVDFDGSSKYLNIDDTSNGLASGTNDFTLEMWLKPSAWTGDSYLLAIDTTGGLLIRHDASGAGSLAFTLKGGGTLLTATGFTPTVGVWTHIALVRHSNKAYLYENGQLIKTSSDISSLSLSSGDTYIGIDQDGNQDEYDGLISNLRFVKGTAVYTSSFRPPTEPLTNITNTTLLCCNNSSITGSTVTPGTITSSGSPTAKTDSPFDDPAGFVFGESGSESVISTGSYIGNGSTTGPIINLGWEPQYLLIKGTTGSTNWMMLDSMRGIVTGGGDKYLIADGNDAEATTGSSGGGIFVNLTSTGFSIHSSSGSVNDNNYNYIYIAIRRSDGYVGKPPSLGTDVFAMDTGNGSTTIPAFDSGFPVDFAFQKLYAGSEDWYTSARLMQGKYFFTNDTNAEGVSGNMVFDSNAGWALESSSSYQSWMWKRHAGLDVVTYTGTGALHEIPHSLSKKPEMQWIKKRSGTEDWIVRHKDINSYTGQGAYLKLNTNDAVSDVWSLNNGVEPTSTYFTFGNHDPVNEDGEDYITMLFASVDGISKVGSYSGTGSSHVITTGFQPRLLIFKETNVANSWFLFDSVRGMSGSEKLLRINMDNAELTLSGTNITLQSTGFTLTGVTCNASGSEWIYYAHA